MPETPAASVPLNETVDPTGPFRLTVLGPVTLRSGAPVALGSALTQSRHLALLSYLVLARPRGLQARAAISELLWPGPDRARARRGLRNALYGLRQALGAGVIVSVGEELIGVTPGAVGSDALDLERGVLDLAGSALSTCQPFDGLRVDEAPAFMQWLEGERERIRSLLNAPRTGAAQPSPSVQVARTPHGLDPGVHYLRGHYLFMRAAHGGAHGDLDLCRSHFERALQLDPDHALAHAGLSNHYAVYARRGPYADFHATFARALAYARRATALDHRLAIPHVHFAVAAQYLDGDWDRAGREFATAVAKEPDYAEGRRFYGVWLSQVLRHEAALAEMETAAMLEPDIPHILSSLGAARLEAGDRTGAEHALLKALAIDPNHRAARLRLIHLLELDERWDHATEERARPPALPGAASFLTARSDPTAYQRVRREAWAEEARTIEARLLEGAEPTTSDIFAPPVVRLVQLLTWLGEAQRARSRRMQAVASDPRMRPWLATVPTSDPR